MNFEATIPNTPITVVKVRPHAAYSKQLIISSMAQQHFSASNKKPALPPKAEEPNSFQLIMADSLEVMEYYYRGKIQEMEQSLSQLTILEHAGKISSICKDIMRTRQLLNNVFVKKNAQYKIHISVK